MACSHARIQPVLRRYILMQVLVCNTFFFSSLQFSLQRTNILPLSLPAWVCVCVCVCVCGVCVVCVCVGGCNEWRDGVFSLFELVVVLRGQKSLFRGGMRACAG